MTGSAPSPVAEAVGAERVSTLELFFDLVFVFTITQLSTLLVHETSWKGVLQAAVMLGVIWWMYDGYAWLTNALPPDRASRRLFLLAAMAAFLVLALAIPDAFTGTGLTFGLAYLAVVLVHAGLYASSTSDSITEAIASLAPYNFVSALMVLAGGITGGTAMYLLWGGAAVFEWATPRLVDNSGFHIAPAHFVERHTLVVIIALGESVVAVGIGAAGLPIHLALLGVAVLGLLLSACLWWAYFGSDDVELAERAIEAAPRVRRQQLAVYAFGMWHLPILFGVIATASTLRHAIGHPSEDLNSEQALLLACGVTLFLIGDVLFRRTLGIAGGPWRVAAAILVLATVPLGVGISAAAQLGAIVVVFAGALAIETLARPAYLSGRSG